MIIAASVLLGAVFLLSGILKVASPQLWRAQSNDLGVPRAVAIVVPYMELVVGALLITQVARRPAAVVAAAMLIGFTVVLVLRLAQGQRPPCACFGTWTSKPIGWTNIARNLALLAAAAAVAVWSG